MKPLYLDDAASTHVRADVLKAMLPLYVETYANPSSPHALGEKARKAIDDARTTLARIIHAKPWEIVFTSGVTEANNLALFGLARANPRKKKIIISAIEHAAIRAPCQVLKREGYTIVEVPVTSEGLVRFDVLEKALDSNTLVVSIMHAHNVLGTIQDSARIGALCTRKGVLFHTDAAQSFGKVAIDVRGANIDLLSASSHKIGGPKGVGFLYIREGVKLEPLIFGGGQERGLRGGTENVPAIVGFAKASELVQRVSFGKIARMRDALMTGLELMGGVIHGSRTQRLYNNVHVSFPHTDGEQIVTRLSQRGIYISTGSACESRGEKDDHVLRAIGLSNTYAKGSLRITISETMTSSDVKRVVDVLKKTL